MIKNKIKRALFVKLNLLGDVIQFLPVIDSFIKAYSNTAITILTTPVGKEIFKMYSSACDFITTDFHELKSLESIFKLFKKIQNGKFDMSFSSTDSNSLIALLLYLSRIPVRIGFNNSRLSFFYNNCMNISGIHTGIQNMNGLKLLGVNTAISKPKLNYLGNQKLTDVSHLINNLGKVKLIGFQLGSKRPNRRWPLNRFAKLAIMLHNKINCRFILLGNEEEIQLAKSFQNILSSEINIKVTDLVGKTSLIEAFQAINKLNAIVCHSSGLLHVAFCTATPSVSIWGASSVDKWGPFWDKNIHKTIVSPIYCSGCELPSCPKPDLECMNSIRTTDVFHELISLLNSHNNQIGK